MKNAFRRLQAVVSSLFLCVPTTSVEAELESRLGGDAYYDTTLDITWLTDANAIAGTIWDDGPSTIDGFASWFSAQDWVGNLTVSGIGGWRLPNMDLDEDDIIVDC
jgi:DUF2075 family protein